METQKALNGIKVLDITSVIMGPFAGRILGDMGADVIKIEPLAGDTVRGVGPMRNPGMGAFYMHANRNKRSIALDLKHPQGKAALLRLTEKADVLLYNVRPQAMERLGIGYAQLKAINPGLVYVGTYGFAQDGPYAKRPAFDDLIQGLAGIPSLIAMSGDGQPRYVPLAIMDRYVGVYAVNAIMGGLFHKMRTGVGQSIEVPMFETGVELVLGDHLGGKTFDPQLGPPGYPRSLSRDRHPFETADGYVCVMVYTDRQWQSFFKLIGQEELATDPRFITMTARTKHSDQLNVMLKKTLKHRSTQEWLAVFDELDVPATRLHDLESLPEDPHLKATNFIRWHEHPSEGRVRVMQPPTTWSETPPGVFRMAPRIGEHSREILLEAGYSEREIAEMVSVRATVLDPGHP